MEYQVRLSVAQWFSEFGTSDAILCLCHFLILRSA